MPDRFVFDRRDASNGFTMTPDSEIVTMYDNGVSMSRIVRSVVWREKIKKTSAEHLVRSVLLRYQLGKARQLPFVSTDSRIYDEFPRSLGVYNPFLRRLSPILDYSQLDASGLPRSKCSECAKMMACGYNEWDCLKDPAAPPPYPIDVAEPFPDAEFD